MNQPSLPRMIRLRQRYSPSALSNIPATVQAELTPLLPRIKPGSSIAIGVGSRGISNLREIVRAVVDSLKAAGAQPFIIPAMGSHGGATPEGQAALLAEYEITEATMGVPVRASLEVRQIGATGEGIPVFCSTVALAADGIVLVNRIKPHTDFGGSLGSGILKMAVIGLGKQQGAATMHAAASRIGYETAIRSMAAVVLEKTQFIAGIGILENQLHQTTRIVLLPRETLPDSETPLQAEARRLMPQLPFSDIDLLVIDYIGKNISGAGIDPNIIGRPVHGYTSSLLRPPDAGVFIRRIFVRDLTPETHGNAIGIGMADVTTTRLVRGMDHRVTYVNALTALTPQGAKIPLYFDTDREAITLILQSLGTGQPRDARVIRIRDTLSLADVEISEAFLPEARTRPDLEIIGDPREMVFDADGNLPPIAASLAGGAALS